MRAGYKTNATVTRVRIVDMAWLIMGTAEWRTIVTSSSAVIAFGASVAVGMIFGIHPAVRASRINPIDALRYE